MGLAFVVLKNWDERKAKEDKVEAIVGRANAKFSQNSGAIIYAFNIPAIVELGTSSGFDLELMDNANHGHEALTQARNQLLGLAGKHPDMLVQVRPNGMEDTSQYHLYVDQQKAEALGVDISTINATMSTMFGGTYVNDFIDRGRVKKSIFRVMHNSVCFLRIFLNSMSAITTVRWFRSPPLLIRRKIRGHLVHHVWSVTTVYRLCRFRECRTGKSSGDAMNLMEDLAKELPPGFGVEWTGMSYQEKMSGNQAPALYTISLIIVFLCLAALYESWSVPFSVMLVVPLGVIGALLLTHARGLENDVYFKVGLLTTIGLSAKNAILIVEFAKDLMEKEGKGLIEATLEAVKMRLRPILMTSLAFMLGVIPLVLSNGAGSGAQNAVGTGVFGGMIAATSLAIFFVPVFYVVIRRRFSKKNEDIEHAHAVTQKSDSPDGF